MPKTVEGQICKDCGVDVRENTVFCYNCGSQVRTVPAAAELNGSDEELSDDAKAALDELAAKFTIDEATDEGKLAHAAEERRKARVRARRSKEFVWEPREDPANLTIVVIAVVVAVLTLGVVIVSQLWP